MKDCEILWSREDVFIATVINKKDRTMTLVFRPNVNHTVVTIKISTKEFPEEKDSTTTTTPISIMNGTLSNSTTTSTTSTSTMVSVSRIIILLSLFQNCADIATEMCLPHKVLGAKHVSIQNVEHQSQFIYV